MKELMTRQFSKWESKQPLGLPALRNALDELKKGSFEASLGGHLYKKRVRFPGRGKSGSGRTIICHKQIATAVKNGDLKEVSR